VRLPLFALVALGTVLIGIIPFPSGAHLEILIALLLFFLLLTTAFVLPWEQLPDWTWLAIPIGYIAVIAIIRDAQGPSHSELLVVYMLPIVWMSLCSAWTWRSWSRSSWSVPPTTRSPPGARSSSW
jgi:hypothetical protein